MTLEEALMALGRDADQVAATLQAKGIKGKTAYAERCPIAIYLKQNNPNYAYVSVGTDVVTACEIGRRCESMYLPVHIQEFIRKFDKEHYPEMILYPKLEED